MAVAVAVGHVGRVLDLHHPREVARRLGGEESSPAVALCREDGCRLLGEVPTEGDEGA